MEEVSNAFIPNNGIVFVAEILFKETKLKNRFIQANSNRYFLRINSSVPMKVKTHVYRSRNYGTLPWSVEEGDLEKDNPFIVSLDSDQTTSALKITRNSFQDHEGTKRSRNQVVTLSDLYQFCLVITEATTG